MESYNYRLGGNIISIHRLQVSKEVSLLTVCELQYADAAVAYPVNSDMALQHHMSTMSDVNRDAASSFIRVRLRSSVILSILMPLQGNFHLFRQNTYLRNKKHTLTCQGGTGCYRVVNYQPGS